MKLNRGLKDSNYDHLYAYLKQHEAHTNEKKMMLDQFTQHTVDPLALMSNVSTLEGNNARGAGAAGYGGAQNRVGNANPGQSRQIKCYNYNGIGHIARNCTQPKRPQNSEYFKDKMLLMQAQENGTQCGYVFQADDCDAFDSDVDEAPTVQTMFMANLSSADPIYDEASPIMESLNSNSQERERERVASVATNARQSKGKLHDIFSATSFISPGSMLLNLDQLEKKLGKEEFQETESIDAFRALKTYSGTESEKHDICSRSGNDTHAEDVDIKPVNDKEPMAEVDSNTTPDSTNMSHRGGEIDQNAEQYQVKGPLLNAELFKTKEMIEKEMYNELSHSVKEASNEAKVKNDIDVIETINIELEHSVAKLLAVNEQLHKENKHLKQNYKELHDSIKKTRVQNKDNSDSLISQINQKSVENADLKAQIQE
ncbi:integrase, catalytic region, zinc finger, CCHC-type containing protein [Tanacetum coccineum]|uniref:Integrase, catalytic region, zinc finger, CCHC-type containing protein n=1 Tax=Tanacetum coccineum TaxID=301880 RepID=A0ABQ5DI94_9ASTR